MTLGEYGPWTLTAARRRVGDLRKDINVGIDPLQGRVEAREAASVASVWKWYSQNFLEKHSSSHQRDLSSSWRRLIIPTFGAQTKLKDVSRADIQAFLDRVTRDNGPVMANRCHSYLRSVLSKALIDGLIPANPAAGGIMRNAEAGRERYLTEKELRRMMLALRHRQGDDSVDALSLLILTGARKAEVLRMEWSEVDFAKATWRVPAKRTKQRKVHRVPLNSRALDILSARHRQKGDEKFVFPGASKSGHLEDIKRAFASLKSACDIHDCTIHDLRHSFASLLMRQGKTLETIGSMLGHSQWQTTKRYAHLYEDRAREVAEDVAKALT